MPYRQAVRHFSCPRTASNSRHWTRYHANASALAPCVPSSNRFVSIGVRRRPSNVARIRAPIFPGTSEGNTAVLNPIITHSPRMAAMATNKPFGEDIARSHAARHREALRLMKRTRTAESQAPRAAEPLREQTA